MSGKETMSIMKLEQLKEMMLKHLVECGKSGNMKLIKSCVDMLEFMTGPDAQPAPPRDAQASDAVAAIRNMIEESRNKTKAGHKYAVLPEFYKKYTELSGKKFILPPGMKLKDYIGQFKEFKLFLFEGERQTAMFVRLAVPADSSDVDGW